MRGQGSKAVIRRAEPSDALAIARVHVRSWQVGYRGLLPDGYLDSLRPEQRAEKYTLGSDDPDRPDTLVAVEAEGIRGFSTTAPARDPDALESGELAALYVDPDFWGQGFGAALVGAARARLFSRGFRSAIVWVLVGNSRGRRFYTVDGWAVDGSERQHEVWGTSLHAIRYRRALTGPVGPRAARS